MVVAIVVVAVAVIVMFFVVMPVALPVFNRTTGYRYRCKYQQSDEPYYLLFHGTFY